MKHRVLVAAVTSLVASFSQAAPLDDATRNNASADSRTASVTTTLTKVGRIVSAQQDVLTRLIRALDDAQERRARLTTLVDEVIQQTDQAIVVEKRELSTNREEAKRAEDALSAARSQLAAARRAVQDATANERKAFEASPEFAKASEAVASRQAALDTLRKDLEAKATTDPAVTQAKQALAPLEAELNKQRAAQDPDALAAASARWIEAKGALETALNAFFARHPPYQSALEKLRESQRSLTQLNTGFETSIQSLPGVAAELRALKTAAADVEACEASLNAAERSLNRTAISLQQQKTTLTLFRKIRVEADFELKQIENDVRRLQLDLRAVNQQLGDALDDLTGVRSALKAVADALRNVDDGNKKK
jgi:chromosome segregation ATPase